MVVGVPNNFSVSADNHDDDAHTHTRTAHIDRCINVC